MQIKEKEILLTGLSNNPNDLTCEDGNLAIALNVVHEEGAIKNACHSAPKVICGITNISYEAIFQHTINEISKRIVIFKHAYRKNEEDFIEYFWVARNDDGEVPNVDSISNSIKFSELDDKELVSFASVGNTLIFYTSEKTYYYLWKNLTYKFIGNEIPEVEMSFGLTPHLYDYCNESSGNTLHQNGFQTYAPKTNNMLDANQNQKQNPFAEEDRTDMSNGVFGLVSLFTDWCNKNGYFSQPFFVRYALRLFDSSHTKPSAPILMIPSTGTNPIIPITKMRFKRTDEGDRYFEYNCVGIGCSMEYFLKDNGVAQQLRNQWTDIVKGIDIFVSEPITTYDPTEKVKWFACDSWGHNVYKGVGPTNLYNVITNNADVSFCKKGSNSSDSKDTMLNMYKSLYPSGYFGNSWFMPTVDDYEMTCHADSYFNPSAFIYLPTRSNAQIDKDIKECANFYLAKDIKTDKLNWYNTRTNLEIEEYALKALATHERLVDDYDSHHTIIPNHTYSYNERLNMANVTKKLFSGFTPFCSFQRVGSGTTTKTAKIEVDIEKNGKSIVLVNSSNDYFASDFSCPYVFYPDSDVKKIKVFVGTNSAYQDYIAEEHKGLNGCFVYTGLTNIKGTRATENSTIGTATTNPTIHLPNYLYTSKVGNPFSFEAKNVERIGGGKIVAIMPQAVAMSQGQFGQFPMIAFTTDGIWTLSVSATGGWSALQPFSRDVLISEKAILLLDREIIFATKRGLMQISGSSVECISEVFNGENDLFTNAYKQYAVNAMSTYCSTNLSSVIAVPTFKNYVNSDKVSMHYDYSHQRIIIGNSNYPYSFVFNMQDKLWTCETLRLHSAVNSYPDALANIKSGSNYILVDLTKEGTASSVGIGTTGFIMTRPIKLDGIGLKTITSVIANGTFHRKHVYLLLYASNDMRTWVVHSTSKTGRLENIFSTPFRFYRIGVVTKLAKGEQLVSLTVGFESRELLSDNN